MEPSSRAPKRAGSSKRPRAGKPAAAPARSLPPDDNVVVLPAAPRAAPPTSGGAAAGGRTTAPPPPSNEEDIVVLPPSQRSSVPPPPPPQPPPPAFPVRALHGAVAERPRGAGKTLYVRVSEWLMAATYVAVAAISITMLVFLFTGDRAAGAHATAFSIAGIFVALTLPLSIHDLHMHCAHYVSPLQRYYVRILFMVPVYSLQSWLALRYPKEKFIFATLRETYEAYTLYMFYMLMLGFLGGPRKLAERLSAKAGRERAAHLPPFCCLKGWRLGNRFVHRCTVAVYQYVVLRVLCSILMLILEPLHLFNEGNWNLAYFYPWSAAIINLSQCYALYGLALFYIECREWLKPLSPLGKFGVIKALVFLTWWQGLLIMILDSAHLIKGTEGWSALDVTKGLQDFAICVEMLFAAIAHRYFFSARDFWSPTTGTVTPLVKMQRAEASFTARQQQQPPPAPQSGAHHAPAGGSSHHLGGGGSGAAVLSFAGAGRARERAAGAEDEPVIVQFGASSSAAARGGAAAPAPATPAAAARGAALSRLSSSSAPSSAGGGGGGGGRGPDPPPGVDGGGGGGEGDDSDVATPAPFMTVVREMLPFDSVGETAEQLRSGFGVLHKWEKRKKEAADNAAQLAQWEREGHTRTRGKSRLAGGAAADGTSVAAAPPPSPTPFSMGGEGDAQDDAPPPR